MVFRLDRLPGQSAKRVFAQLFRASENSTTARKAQMAGTNARAMMVSARS
jgi:hypothetical protein